MNKRIRIDKISEDIGNRHIRKLRKYSNGFNQMFTFFLLSNKYGILEFCGSDINILFDKNSENAKECFRLYDDGHYKNKDIYSKHPNILKKSIQGKKSWGLWVDQWSDGISECSFKLEDILYEFEKFNITIPEKLLIDFNNRIYQKKLKKIEKYFLEKYN